MLNAHQIVGTHNILFITLDTLRYDVAQRELETGGTPNLAHVIPAQRWEARHTPGSFTYAAHQAFFAGFLPTPVEPGIHQRLFATQFPGSATSRDLTYVFAAPSIVAGFAGLGYYTICIGGVGFFNKLSPLGCVLPSLFHESHWSPSLGVTDPHSTENQIRLAQERLRRLEDGQRVFLFVNISAIHQPNSIFLPGAEHDTLASHAAALRYVDACLPQLFLAMQQRGPTLIVVCSDHGTAYGEDGYSGHRIGHPVVWTVPYAEFILPGERRD